MENVKTGHRRPGARHRKVGSQPKNKEWFEPHVTLHEAEKGLAGKQFFLGRLSIPRRYAGDTSFVRGFPNPASWASDVLVEGKDRNRALDGDIVVVALHPRSQWKTREVPREVGCSNAASPATEVLPDLQLLLRAASSPPSASPTELVTGKVVHICQRPAAVSIVARVSGGEERVRCNPINDRNPTLYAPGVSLPQGEHLVKVILDKWETHCKRPLGRIEHVFGPAGVASSWVAAVLHDEQVAWGEFPASCMSEVPSDGAAFVQKLSKGRRDCRDECVISIDPPGARDLDDALSCRRLPDGTLIVGVHIADVAAVVEEGSCLDTEAFKRGTTVYCPGQVVPMLPRALCETLCSLNTFSDKLAMTIEWVMDGQGNILDEWMGETIIRNARAMTYEEAQNVIGGEAPPDLPSGICDMIRNLWEIASKLRKRRSTADLLAGARKGRLRFEFEGDADVPCGWHLEGGGTQANWLVEELMVLANARVAEKCVHTCRQKALLRTHAPPDIDRLAVLAVALQHKHHGLTEDADIDISSPASFASSLKRFSQKKLPATDTFLRLATRCFRSASYGSAEQDDLQHFGMDLSMYTHFTSPIRRYADLAVHRILKHALGVGQEPSAVSSLVHRCNERKATAARVSDRCGLALYSLYLKQTGNVDRLTGVLCRIRNKTLTVFIEELGVERDMYLDNGCKEQVWFGGARKDSDTVVSIQWWPGVWQEAPLLTSWELKVFKAQGADYCVQIVPPPHLEPNDEIDYLSRCNTL